jgi:hypothetical protein
MEQFIKNNNVSDITYPECGHFLSVTSGSRSYSSQRNFIRDRSELILGIFDVKDLIRTNNLRRTLSASVSYVLIKC